MTYYSTPFTLFFGLLLMTFPGLSINASGANFSGAVLLSDFTSVNSDLGWYVVNDTVMGGRSDGDFKQHDGKLRFTGLTNTRGGGFSSIRTKPLRLNLSNHTGIQLYVKGDGRRYTWRLTTNARWRGRQVSYWADFDTQSGAWSTVNIPFSKFIPQYRGYKLDERTLDVSEITGMGLMIYDKEDGPFELHLASVHAYSVEAPFTLMQYQWKSRVLVVSALSEDDENLKKQQNEVAFTSEEFAARDMVLVTLLDKAVSTADDRALSTWEAATARAALGIRSGSFALRLIGKDGAVKLSGETATSMDEIYSLIDSMPMRQKEEALKQ